MKQPLAKPDLSEITFSEQASEAPVAAGDALVFHLECGSITSTGAAGAASTGGGEWQKPSVNRAARGPSSS